jgi:hypothetical protein
MGQLRDQIRGQRQTLGTIQFPGQWPEPDSQNPHHAYAGWVKQWRSEIQKAQETMSTLETTLDNMVSILRQLDESAAAAFDS